MKQSPTAATLPDPMHLEPWEEQDEPLASDRHHDEQTYCFEALRHLLNPDGHYATMDRWLRMDPADDHDRLLPDLLVATGLLQAQWNRNEYLPWVAGKAPEILGEFLSPSSLLADLVEKPRRYGALGVREYYVFDPDGSVGVPRVQGWVLQGEEQRQELPRDPDGGLTSRVVPIRFELIDDHITVVDSRSGEIALRYGDVQHVLHQERAARRRAESAREAAESEVRRLRAELDRLRGDHGRNGF